MNKHFLPMPCLMYGTAWKKERTAELVEKAILLGFRGIDTACQPKHYYEAGVGQALQRLREQGIARETLFLQTKFTPLAGQDPARIPYDPNATLREQVEQSFSASLQNLEVDYIDSLLLHSPLSSHTQTMEVWQAMEKLNRQGVVNMLGISNCYDHATFEMLYNDSVVKPSVLQNRFYNVTDYDRRLRALIRDKNIHYQSFWTLTANPEVLGDPLLIDMATAKRVTPEQVFFRFLTQQQIVPLIGSCTEKHMQEDLAIFDFILTDEEFDQINALLIG